jgi:NADH-quinone oxidoreductase subunit E
VISPETRSKIEALKAKYPLARSALVPALHLAQREIGYLSPEAMREVAALVGVPPVEAASVASFYTMLQRKPVGRHVIQVCTNLSCSLLGAEHLVEVLRRRLGIDVGQTTPDGRFTLETVECLGSCGTAPVMQIDDDYYENVTEESLDRILFELSHD